MIHVINFMHEWVTIKEQSNIPSIKKRIATIDVKLPSIPVHGQFILKSFDSVLTVPLKLRVHNTSISSEI